MSGRLLVAVTPLFLSFAFNSASGQTIKDFPEGAGKPFVEQICMQCHEPAFLLQQRRTDDDWKKTVARMSRKGAGGAPEAYDTVAAYMAKNFGRVDQEGKVNMNKVTVDELVEKLGFTK